MKKIFAFILIFAVLLSSCAKEETEIVEENEIIEESVSSGSEISEEIEEEDEKETYYDEVLEIPENPVKNEENKALSESFEFSGPTKEISVITAAHYDKTINLVIPEDAVLEGEDYYLKAVFLTEASFPPAGFLYINLRKQQDMTIPFIITAIRKNPSAILLTKKRFAENMNAFA